MLTSKALKDCNNRSKSQFLGIRHIFREICSLTICCCIREVNQHSSTLIYMYVSIAKCLHSVSQIFMLGK